MSPLSCKNYLCFKPVLKVLKILKVVQALYPPSPRNRGGTRLCEKGGGVNCA